MHPFHIDSNLHKGKILVVDNEPAMAAMLVRVLRHERFQNVAYTTDSKEAVPRIQNEQPDLLILDLKMPPPGGFEVLSMLRELEPECVPAILVLTAEPDQEPRNRALNEGANDFLTKPFDNEELIARTRNLLALRLAQKDLRNHNAILEETVNQRTRELRRTRLEIVRRLGRASEYRDHETGMHIIRMSHVVVLLAEQLGLDERRQELLMHASPMHDVGKIGLPDSILKKRGLLTPRERRVMQQHTTIGADILSGDTSEVLTLAREIALYHHERWDGTGYPYGLVGEATPLGGRIAAVADVFDALISERPYKPAWTPEKAAELIARESGRHFDPEVAEALERTRPRLLKIREEFPDHSM